MARVLVIEDEADLREVLQYNLTQAGHRAFAAGTGELGIKLAHEVRPEVVLLDLMLPDVSGTQVAKALRRDPETHLVPIIMVSARAEEVDRVVGFELGADDYVVKPFGVRELLARVKALLRRAGPAEAAASILRAGGIELDVERYEVRVRSTMRANMAPDEAILRESKRGYDLIVLGVSRRPGDTLFFGNTAAAVLDRSETSNLFVAS